MLSAVLQLALAAAPGSSPKAVYVPYAEAKHVLEALRALLPEPLRTADAAQQAALWPGWVAARDREIRARLVQGAEDSVAHFMLFGTSFTREPRATLQDLRRLLTGEAAPVAGRLAARVRDLAGALSKPGANERLAFIRRLLEEKGLEPGAPRGRAAAERYLYENLKRVLREDDGYAKALEVARGLGDASAEFAARSKLFSSRGLSSDTSLLPNLALEQSLAEIAQRAWLKPGSVRRVAVVGPGLDFTDKQDGYDFYPQQTLQPFAVMDSLLRLGLAKPGELRVVAYDLNPQVNDHLERATAAARSGRSYAVQLPRDLDAGWTAEAVRYWEGFGDRIGSPAASVSLPPGLGKVRTRAVSVRPELVARVEAGDLNVVLQRPALREGEAFDLVIATNILVYYDTFEQCLALANVAAMLRPGGFLLSNNAVLELPGASMRSVGYKTTAYSDRPGDGDHVVWYRRLIE